MVKSETMCAKLMAKCAGVYSRVALCSRVYKGEFVLAKEWPEETNGNIVGRSTWFYKKNSRKLR